MTVVDFVRLTRANAVVIFVMFSVGLLGGFLYAFHQPVVYTATSQGYVAVNGDASVSGLASANSLAQQKLSTYAGLATSTKVAQDVIERLGLDATPGEIAGRFSAAADDGRPVVTIFATAPTPGQARDLANAVIGAMSQEAAALESAARPEGAPESSLVRLVPTEQAQAPSRPSSPNYLRALGIGAVAGIVLGYAASLVRRQLDRRIRTVDDIESLIGTSVLSIIPEDRELDRARAAGLVRSGSGAAPEALRQLRTNLRFVDVDRPPRSIVVTSANAGEGKSVVAGNLGRMLAAAGQPTVIIDADLRRPMMAEMFDLDPAVGLTQVLAGDVAVQEVIADPRVPHLQVIVAGRIPPNPSELLGSQRMQTLIRTLVDEGYQVIIDAPPLLPVTDAGLLAGTVDGALLVLAVGRTYKEQARLAAKILGQVGGHLLGAVVNLAPVRGIGSVVYGYGYGSSRGGDYYAPYGSPGYGGPRRRASSGQGSPASPPRSTSAVRPADAPEPGAAAPPDDVPVGWASSSRSPRPPD